MKEITYEQFRKFVTEAKERGCSPNIMILFKPIKDKRIRICGIEFIITPNPFLGSIDGIDIYLDDGCLPDSMFLLNRKFPNEEVEYLYREELKQSLNHTRDKTIQKMLNGYAKIIKSLPNVVIPVWVDPKIIDATKRRTPLCNLIPKSGEVKIKREPLATLWNKIKIILGFKRKRGFYGLDRK